MEVYREQTEPLIAYYRQKGKLQDIAAEKQTAEVLAEFKTRF